MATTIVLNDMRTAPTPQHDPPPGKDAGRRDVRRRLHPSSSSMDRGPSNARSAGPSPFSQVTRAST